jgi:putative salt-induced outer membrane protein YdiY
MIQLRGPCFGLAFTTALLIGTSLVSVRGQTPAVTNAPPPKNPWETTAAVGFTLTSGNSETILATLSLDTKRKWDHNEAGFGVAGAYGEDRNDSTGGPNTEFLNAFGQYNRLLTDRLYAGLRVDYTYDAIADLNYRVTISPLAGYYLIKATNTTLAAEVGPSVVFEKYFSQGQDTYLGIRFGERFEHKLSPTTKIWESASYVPQVDKWTENYIINAEAGIDVAITKHWSLRVMVQDVYASQPAAGRKNNDVRVIAGTSYKF